MAQHYAPRNAPPILDRLNLSAELWLHLVEHFGKRRIANRVTAASRFNATAKPADLVFAARLRWITRKSRLSAICSPCLDGPMWTGRKPTLRIHEMI